MRLKKKIRNHKQRLARKVGLEDSELVISYFIGFLVLMKLSGEFESRAIDRFPTDDESVFQ